MKEFIDKLISMLEKYHKESEDYYFELECEDCLVAMKTYKHVISIVNELAEEYKGGWIPCSERLPEKGGSYIVYSKTGCVYMSHYYKNSVVPHWSKNGENILAWMPLPAPYTEGE